MQNAVIVDAVRTPLGKRNGKLKDVHPVELAAHTLRALVERNDIDPERVDDVVGGCVTQSGEQGCNVTRNAWVGGGVPWSVPATSVDRRGGSSRQTADRVAQGGRAGTADHAMAYGGGRRGRDRATRGGDPTGRCHRDQRHGGPGGGWGPYCMVGSQAAELTRMPVTR